MITLSTQRVARLGAGLKIDSLSVNTLSEAFIKATSDRIIKEKAEQIKEQIQAEDGPSRAVQFM
jgi:sterol 3beta-glucosyltransferase